MSESKQQRDIAASPDPIERILQWSQQAKEYETVSWDHMPEIDIYMDQVITYMDKQLRLFQVKENSKLLTSSMINNYVKDGLLPRPDHKKYSREHLAGLLIICMLKQVLSISDISALSQELSLESSPEQLHSIFCSIEKSALQEVCERVENTAPQGESQLKQLAFTLSIEATARRAAAERILGELNPAKKEGKAK